MENFGVFRERLKRLLMSLPDAKLESGGKAVMLRCRYCGDSKRNKSSRHMYVYLPNGNNPIFHICYRANCAVKGIVTWQKLVEWGVNLSEEDIKDLVNYNKEIFRNGNDMNFNCEDINILTNTYINNNFNQMYDYKIQYINNRLGTNFTHQDLKNLKISLNLSELLIENELPINIEDWKLRALSEKYICFITQDNSYAVCRNTMYKENEKSPMNYRYFKYNIFNRNSNSKPFYIIPTTVDIYKKIRIYLSEGTFDILSVKYNVVNDPNGIYCAVLGGGFINAIKYFICEMKLIDLEFHLYLDNDMSSNKIFEMLELLRPYQYNVFVHTNRFQGEKDFGVPRDRIIDYSQQMIKGW